MTRHAGLLRLGLLCLLAATGSASPWGALRSDLPLDPAVRSGTLPNGLRYLIRPNAEPRGRVSLRLLVASGSLLETGSERGLAHFIEHMAFRGTAAFPHSSLTTALERRGIGLGPDSTAFTSYDYTVYHLELPDVRPDTLRFGLNAFREYASAVTFAPEDIERERGVVLSEQDTRNTPQERLFEANLRFLWPASRQSRRAPIGLEACIRSFTRDQFVAFYDAWYRPERMAVIVVGDIDPAGIEALVREIFGPLAARAPARAEPADLVPERAARPTIGIQSDDGLSGVRIFFTHPQPRPDPVDTHAVRVAALHRSLAFAMFAKRLEWDAHRRNAAFVSPAVTTDTYLPGWEVVSFSAAGQTDQWARVAAELEQEHRRAYLLGFTADELRLAKTRLANDYEEAVRSAPTRRSEWLAAQAESYLLYGGALATPAAWQHDLAADLEAATPEDCLRAFRRAWTADALHVLIAANSKFTATAGQVGATLNASRQVAVHPPDNQPAIEFAYTTFGPAGTLVRDSYLGDIDAHLSEFTNGVKLNFKPTKFEADMVEVSVRVGTGKLSQPDTEPGLDLLANYGLIGSGIGRHTTEELDQVLARHLLSVGFSIEPDACCFTAHCTRRELPLALRVITAYLTDPAFRPEAMTDTRAALGSLYSSLNAAASGPLSQNVERVMTGFNSLVGLAAPDEAYARIFPELAHWLKPQFKHGAIELSVVGDTTWAETAAAVGETLGALPSREPYAVPSLAEPIRFVSAPPKPFIYDLPTSIRQVALGWYWPVKDLADVHQERRCRLLAAVLGELLNLRLRQELGATYTPSADFVQYDGWPDFSYFSLRADVAFAEGPHAARIIRRELEAMLAHGIDDDVFERAKRPFLTAREEDLRSNSYWCHTVLGDAQLRPYRLAAARDRAADTAAITRPELEALARRYLDPERGFLFVAEPGSDHFWGRK